MTLALRTLAAARAMQDRANRNELLGQAQVLIARNQALEALTSRVERARAKRQALLDHKLPVADLGPVRVAHLAAYQASQDYPQPSWDRLKPALESTIKGIETKVQTAIQAVTRDLPFAQIGPELQGYRNDPLLHGKATPLQQIVDRNRKDPREMSAQELQALFADLKVLRAGLEGLRLARPSAPLSAFLGKVRSPAGAAPEDLTPEIRKEALERNLMGNIRLRWV